MLPLLLLAHRSLRLCSCSQWHFPSKIGALPFTISLAPPGGISLSLLWTPLNQVEAKWRENNSHHHLVAVGCGGILAPCFALLIPWQGEGRSKCQVNLPSSTSFCCVNVGWVEAQLSTGTCWYWSRGRTECWVVSISHSAFDAEWKWRLCSPLGPADPGGREDHCLLVLTRTASFSLIAAQSVWFIFPLGHTDSRVGGKWSDEQLQFLLSYLVLSMPVGGGSSAHHSPLLTLLWWGNWTTISFC